MMLQAYIIWLRAWADTLQAMAPPAPVKAQPVRKPCHLRVVK